MTLFWNGAPICAFMYIFQMQVNAKLHTVIGFFKFNLSTILIDMRRLCQGVEYVKLLLCHFIVLFSFIYNYET